MQRKYKGNAKGFQVNAVRQRGSFGTPHSVTRWGGGAVVIGPRWGQPGGGAVVVVGPPALCSEIPLLICCKSFERINE